MSLSWLNSVWIRELLLLPRQLKCQAATKVNFKHTLNLCTPIPFIKNVLSALQSISTAELHSARIYSLGRTVSSPVQNRNAQTPACLVGYS